MPRARPVIGGFPLEACMDATHKERLLLLAGFLEKLPPEKFNYGQWAGTDRTATSCGTVGCALGWAASMPEFQALGAGLTPYDPARPGGSVFTLGGAPCGSSPLIKELFGEGEEVHDLFYPHLCEDDCYDGCIDPDQLTSDATPEQVARRIRDYVAYEES